MTLSISGLFQIGGFWSWFFERSFGYVMRGQRRRCQPYVVSIQRLYSFWIQGYSKWIQNKHSKVGERILLRYMDSRQRLAAEQHRMKKIAVKNKI